VGDGCLLGERKGFVWMHLGVPRESRMSMRTFVSACRSGSCLGVGGSKGRGGRAEKVARVKFTCLTDGINLNSRFNRRMTLKRQ
jgi:hypothetical protein